MREQISIDATLITLVSLYAGFQLFFYFLNLPASPLYIFPVLLIPAFLLFRVIAVSSWEFERFSLLLLIVAVVSGVATFFLHPYPDPYDHLKYLLLYFFYFMGVNSHLATSLAAFRRAWFLILVLPIFLVVYYLFFLKGSGTYFGSVAFLANRNNLSGLIMAILFTASLNFPRFPWWLLLLPILLLIGTLGGVVAIGGAVLFCYGLQPRYFLAATFAVAGVAGLAVYAEWSSVSRLTNAFLLLQTMWEANFFEAISTMTFGDAARVVGNASDTSVFFRLKQWSEILLTMATNPSYLLSGFGFRASESLTTSQLLPHNDWLRILFEGGVVSAVCFASLALTALRDLRCYRRQSYVLGMSLFIFMLTDNLIDNFLLSFLLFYGLGLVRQSAHQRSRSSHQISSPQIEPPSATLEEYPQPS